MKYSKTEAGQQAFKSRSSLLTGRQRSAYILFDGIKTDAQVLSMTAGLGITQADLDHLLQAGFLALEPGAEEVSAPVNSVMLEVQPVAVRTAQERYSAAKPIATQLTASLGLRGFRLNLAVESAGGYQDLLDLLPKIQASVGVKECLPLELALKG